MSCRAVRWKATTGVAQRTISSGAVRGRSALYSSHCSGKSTKAFMPCVVALRVVSLPATASRMTNQANSSDPSDSPSMSAVTSWLTMSSAGHLRRSSARFQEYPMISAVATLWLPSKSGSS
ncbi:Uncharacterised protein [Mycobacteroides abscessus subsp. abscessus]|nr:Uncharacterised protein [Mycobacteroides abscessus subsp. abscessus]